MVEMNFFLLCMGVLYTTVTLLLGVHIGRGEVDGHKRTSNIGVGEEHSESIQSIPGRFDKRG